MFPQTVLACEGKFTLPVAMIFPERLTAIARDPPEPTSNPIATLKRFCKVTTLKKVSTANNSRFDLIGNLVDHQLSLLFLEEYFSKRLVIKIETISTRPITMIVASPLTPVRDNPFLSS